MGLAVEVDKQLSGVRWQEVEVAVLEEVTTVGMKNMKSMKNLENMEKLENLAGVEKKKNISSYFIISTLDILQIQLWRPQQLYIKSFHQTPPCHFAVWKT